MGLHNELDGYQQSLHIHLDPSLLIGVPSIDKEHYDLVMQLKSLARHVDDVDSRMDTFSEIMSELSVQLFTHFATEERVFKSFDMPDPLVLSHIQAHTEIIEKITALNLDEMNGAVVNRSKILLDVRNWILGHIELHDLQIKNYVPVTVGSDKR